MQQLLYKRKFMNKHERNKETKFLQYKIKVIITDLWK